MKPLVLYHGGCYDGFTAAWVAYRALGKIEALPVLYGQPAPDCAGREVYVLDFSYPRAILEAMHASAKKLVVIDHHKSAMKDLEGLSYCIFRDDASGARLTWEYFNLPAIEPYGPVTPPWLVTYTEDRDLWRHKLPYTREINAALRSYEFSFKQWDAFHAIDMQIFLAKDFVAEGCAILRRERQIIDQHLRHVREIKLGPYTFPAVNASVLFSEIAGEVAKGHPFGACYFDRDDGKRQWSLRSDEDGVDVSEVAKHFGGGGHRHAAGFETPNIEIVDIDSLNELVSFIERCAVLEAKVTRLNFLLNTPETENFDKAVPLEAAHQVNRWGSEHDAGKQPEDWFWLLGYLAGKALASVKAGDMEKAKHHCISSAAVLRNWHAHIRSGDSLMRPGIEPPEDS